MRLIFLQLNMKFNYSKVNEKLLKIFFTRTDFFIIENIYKKRYFLFLMKLFLLLPFIIQ